MNKYIWSAKEVTESNTESVLSIKQLAFLNSDQLVTELKKGS